MGFDQFVNSLSAGAKLAKYHEQFMAVGKGSLKNLAKFDWKAADLDQISGLAKSVTQKATSEGIKVGAHFIGELLETWGIGLSSAAVLTGGASAVPGGFAAAIGAAISWGADTLIDKLWPTESEAYKEGDLIVINKNRASAHAGLRRRLPSEIIDAAIVTGKEDDGFVTAYNFRTNKTDTYAIQDVARVDPQTERKLKEESPELRNAQDMVKELSQVQRRRGKYHHTTKVGDLVKFQEQVVEITSTDWNKRSMILRMDNGDMAVVQMGDEDISDVNLKTGKYFNAGEFAWLAREKKLQKADGTILRFPYQAVAIRATTTHTSEVVSVFNGFIEEVSNRNLCLADDLNADKSTYAKFLSEVADELSTPRDWMALTPGRGDKRSGVYMWVSEDPHDQIDIEGEFEADDEDEMLYLKTHHDQEMAKAMDQYRDINHGLTPRFDDPVDRWGEPGYQPTSESGGGGGNTTLLLMGGAAALVAIYAM